MLDFIGIDLWVLGFTVAITLLVALLVGLPAAWHAARPNLNEALKDVGTTAAGAFRSRRIHSLLVVGEVAIVPVLVIGAGLMVQSLIRLSWTDPGFRTDHVLTMEPLPPSAKYNEERRVAFCADLVQRVERLPQVVSMARMDNTPMTGWDNWIEFHIPGRWSRPGKMPRVISRVVTAAYFSDESGEYALHVRNSDGTGRRKENRSGPAAGLLLLTGVVTRLKEDRLQGPPTIPLVRGC